MHPDIDIIYYTLFPWDNVYSSVSLSFTREFAKNNRVFYINPPYSLKDFATKWKEPQTKERRSDFLRNRMRYESIPGLPENVIAVQPPMTIPINFMAEGKMYESLAHRNNQIVLKTIEQVIKDYNLKNYIYLNCFNPYTGGFLPRPRFEPLLSIYQCIDDMEEEAYTAKHGARVEKEVIKQSDMAFVTSTNLWKLKSPFNPNTFVLHNAADISIFRTAVEKELEKPADIAHITTPIIGFTGNLDPNRINYDLLGKIALHHTDKTLVLVGPVNSDEVTAKGLDKLDNIVFTGGKNIKELPSYLQHMDCTIIPFSCNKLTASIYPLKINEYLAAAKAVVSTNFSDDIRGFKDVIYLGETDEEFLQLIDQAIQDNDPALREARIRVANSNSWTARVEQFWGFVDQVLAKPVS